MPPRAVCCPEVSAGDCSTCAACPLWGCSPVFLRVPARCPAARTDIARSWCDPAACRWAEAMGVRPWRVGCLGREATHPDPSSHQCAIPLPARQLKPEAWRQATAHPRGSGTAAIALPPKGTHGYPPHLEEGRLADFIARQSLSSAHERRYKVQGANGAAEATSSGC